MELSNGSVAVVTGAASGIGAALARAFAAAGCSVVLADVDAVALDAVAATMEEEVLTVVTDVSVAADLEHLAETAFNRFGAVHVLCNNAGVSTFNPVVAQSLDDWRWVLGVNLWGVIHGVQAFLPRMTAQGQPAHIVNTSSLAGLASGLPALAPYNVSKVGVVALSETLRMELAMAGSPVGVSVLCPGSTPTRILESERNRPAALGSELRVPDGDLMREAVRSGFDGPGARTVDEVAGDVLDGVRGGQFWIITSDEMRELVSSRFHEIDGSTPQG
jgi:NAD(P)-dependent dehydrogenase (short-subunit alcohol dehydrogenase family)